MTAFPNLACGAYGCSTQGSREKAGPRAGVKQRLPVNINLNLLSSFQPALCFSRTNLHGSCRAASRAMSVGFAFSKGGSLPECENSLLIRSHYAHTDVSSHIISTVAPAFSGIATKNQRALEQIGCPGLLFWRNMRP